MLACVPVSDVWWLGQHSHPPIQATHRESDPARPASIGPDQNNQPITTKKFLTRGHWQLPAAFVPPVTGAMEVLGTVKALSRNRAAWQQLLVAAASSDDSLSASVVPSAGQSVTPLKCWCLLQGHTSHSGCQVQVPPLHFAAPYKVALIFVEWESDVSHLVLTEWKGVRRKEESPN